MASINLPRLQLKLIYVEKDGKPTVIFQKHWDLLATTAETQINGLQEVVDEVQAQSLILTDLVEFQQNFIDAIAPLIVSMEARISVLEARLLAAGIP